MTTFRLLGTVAEASLGRELYDDLGGSLHRLSSATPPPVVAALGFPGEAVGTGFLGGTYEGAKLDVEGMASGIPGKGLVPDNVVVAGTPRCLLAAHQCVVEGRSVQTTAGPSVGRGIDDKRGRVHRSGNRAVVDQKSSTRLSSWAQVLLHGRTGPVLHVGDTVALRSPVGVAPTADGQLAGGGRQAMGA